MISAKPLPISTHLDENQPPPNDLTSNESNRCRISWRDGDDTPYRTCDGDCSVAQPQRLGGRVCTASSFDLDAIGIQLVSGRADYPKSDRHRHKPARAR